MIDRTMAPAADADITPFGTSCAGGAPPLALQLGWGRCLDHQFDKLEGATQQGIIFEIEPSPQPMLVGSAHAAGAEDRRFTPSLWHVRMGATCGDAR
jgi:hypothetical protein